MPLRFGRQSLPFNGRDDKLTAYEYSYDRSREIDGQRTKDKGWIWRGQMDLFDWRGYEYE